MKRTVGHEKYYTHSAVAEECVRLADDTLTLRSFDWLVEPSAGDGAFFELLPPDRRVGIDLAPSHPSVQQADFLAWDWRRHLAAGRTLVIGNPPFGQRAALAFDFIERAAIFADAIAFILPRSFNKWTFQNRFPARFHLLASLDCEDFIVDDGRAHQVKTVFQVWERRPEMRPKIEVTDSHPDFEMRHAHLSRTSPEEIERLRSEYAFTIPQVGANFRPREPGSVTRGSHWFIKPKAANVRSIFEALDFSFLDGKNTAHKSLSKADIVHAYVDALSRIGVHRDLEEVSDVDLDRADRELLLF